MEAETIFVASSNPNAGEYAIILIKGETSTQLPLRLDLRNHSPTGFAWGYGGSGPAQLALAMLAYIFDDEIALANYQRFKSEVIGNLPANWTMPVSQVKSWLESTKEEGKSND